jgi:hypothetical protein
MCEDLQEHAHEIVNEWNRLAQNQPRLSDLPMAYRWDSLPRAVSGLLGATLCAPRDRAMQRELVEAALAHGQHRRTSDIPPDMVFTEYALLHDAVWRHIQRVEEPKQQLEAILKVDIGISLATRASLTGYHHTELKANGAWADVVNHLVEEALQFNRNN